MNKSAEPLISVILPVYNGEKYLADAIESILTQTFTDFELLVVDDGSQDGSAEIVRKYAKRDERIRLLQHESNQGHAAARNSGLEAAQGKFIAAMDADDISLPERLRKQVDFMQSHSKIGLLGVHWLQVDENLKPISDHIMPLEHALIVLRLFFRRNSLAGPTILMRRETLDSVDGYDARSSTGDTDLFARLVGKTRFANLPLTLYLRRNHGRNHSTIHSQQNFSEGYAIRDRWLQRLWGEAPGAAGERIERLRKREKFGWRERRLLRRDLDRLAEALLADNALELSDMPLVEAEFARRLEWTTPRLWQMVLHWRRHRLGW